MKDKLNKLVFGSETIGGLLLRILVLLAIPYAYLMICGLIFDKILRLYSMTTFIFFSTMLLWIIAIIVDIKAIKKFITKPETVKTNKAETVEQVETVETAEVDEADTTEADTVETAEVNEADTTEADTVETAEVDEADTTEAETTEQVETREN